MKAEIIISVNQFIANNAVANRRGQWLQLKASSEQELCTDPSQDSAFE